MPSFRDCWRVIVRGRVSEVFWESHVMLQMTHQSLVQRLQNKRHSLFLVSAWFLPFLDFLFLYRRAKVRLNKPTGEQQNPEGNQVKAPCQRSGLHIRHQLLGVRHKTTAECIGNETSSCGLVTDG